MRNDVLSKVSGCVKPLHTLYASAVVLLAAAVAVEARPLGETFFEDFSRFERDRWYVSDGWSNGRHQNCLWSKEAVSHEQGQVSLIFERHETADHAYRCGEIQTRPRFGYGTFEARIKTDEGSGLNAAFFTYIGEVHGERHDEIDFEVLMANTREVEVNTYVDGKPRHRAVVPLDEPAHERFYTYSFVWEQGRMRWYVDGRLVHEVESADLPERPQKIYLSLWGSDTLTDWMGPFREPQGPKQMDIDWVAYTALGEPCAFGESVLCDPEFEE